MNLPVEYAFIVIWSVDETAMLMVMKLSRNSVMRRKIGGSEQKRSSKEPRTSFDGLRSDLKLLYCDVRVKSGPLVYLSRRNFEGGSCSTTAMCSRCMKLTSTSGFWVLLFSWSTDKQFSYLSRVVIFETSFFQRSQYKLPREDSLDLLTGEVGKSKRTTNEEVTSKEEAVKDWKTIASKCSTNIRAD